MRDFPLFLKTAFARAPRRARRSTVRTSLAAAALVYALAASACTDAEFDTTRATDGGRDGDARASADAGASGTPPDAGPFGGAEDPDGSAQAVSPNDAMPPAWAEKLRGDYVLRLRIYTREKTTGASATHEIISAVQVYFDAAVAEVRMRVKMCNDTGDALGGLFRGALAFPHRYPERVLRVGYAQGEFFTENTTSGVIGYSEQVRADCKPGALVTRGPDQGWLNTGPCTCPSNASALPTSRLDCRLTDPDQDGSPGLTVRITSAGLPSRDFVVTRDQSQIVGGKIADDKLHTGTYRVNQETVQVECPDGTCTTPEISNCPPTANTAELAPLAALPDGAMYECPLLLQTYESGATKLSSQPIKFPDTICP